AHEPATSDAPPAAVAPVADPPAPPLGASPDPAGSSAALTARMGDFVHNPSAIADVEHAWRDARGLPVGAFQAGEPIPPAIRFRPLADIKRLVPGVPVWSEDGQFVIAFGTQGRSIIERVPAGARHEVILDIAGLPLNKGRFPAVLAILDGTEYLFRQPIDPLEILDSKAKLSWGLI